MPQWASTLLAVFIGGLLTFLTQWLIERRRAASERQHDAARVAVELRIAMRLVLDDLDAIALHYRMLADDGRYPDARDEEESRLYFPTAAWDANKRTLAAELSNEQWGALSGEMHGAAHARVIVLRGNSLAPIQPPIRQVLRDGAQNARELYVSLTGTAPPTVP